MNYLSKNLLFISLITPFTALYADDNQNHQENETQDTASLQTSLKVNNSEIDLDNLFLGIFENKLNGAQPDEPL